VRSILELVIKDIDFICKIFPTMLHGYTREWCHNLELGFILYFYDIRSKLISCFNTSIPAKKKTP
jgi:hypothetical protein